MKHSELLFKIPVRLFIKEPNEEDLEVGIIPPYAIGYERVNIEDIDTWGDCFILTRNIESVRENGFDSTRITFLNGEIIICSWSREKFEKNYDEHFDALETYYELLENELEFEFINQE